MRFCCAPAREMSRVGCRSELVEKGQRGCEGKRYHGEHTEEPLEGGPILPVGLQVAHVPYLTKHG